MSEAYTDPQWDELVSTLLTVYNAEGCVRWLNVPQQQWGYLNAAEMFGRGRVEEVLQAARQLADGACA